MLSLVFHILKLLLAIPLDGRSYAELLGTYMSSRLAYRPGQVFVGYNGRSKFIGRCGS